MLESLIFFVFHRATVLNASVRQCHFLKNTGTQELILGYFFFQIYVCTPTYKFSMEMMEEVNDFESPLLIVPEGKENAINNINVAIAKFDYVPPEKVASFITNK